MQLKLKFNNRSIRRLFARRKYKDFLFQRVFREKEDLLDLYNAVNGTSYSDPNALEITTLEDAIYMSMKNDKSFIMSSTLNLYEHQSTVNPNMPIRGLLYFSRLYEAYISLHKLDIYGRKKVSLPLPRYIVFYNGMENIADVTTLRLSESFMINNDSNDEPALECIATILNINYGHNEKTLNACKRLGDYSHFIYKVNEGLYNGLSKVAAIDNAIDYCIENDILSDILTKHRAEVRGMLLFCYDEKLHNETLRKEGYEDRQAEVDALQATIVEKDAAIADKDAIIATLMAENMELRSRK